MEQIGHEMIILFVRDAKTNLGGAFGLIQTVELFR